MKHLFHEPFLSYFKKMEVVRKRGQNGIDILESISKHRGDGLVERFNNASGGNAQSTLNKPGCSLI